MKFAVKAWSSGRARAGVLQLGSCPSPIETPALLLSTRKACPLSIPPDLLPSLPSPDSHLLHVSSLHFLEGISPQTISDIGGLHKMLGLPGHVFVAIARDSVQCLPEWNSTNNWERLSRLPVAQVKPVELNDGHILIFQNVGGGSVFGSVVGGSSVQERERCAQEVASRSVSGYWIGGFGLGESMDERPALLNAVTDILEEEKPRLVSGLGLPEEVLQGVSAGIDIFDSTYIYHLTLGGFALTFPLDGVETYVSAFQLTNIGSDQTKINLRATIYRKDTSPIVENCNCYTCQNHTKAYINHLLNVHEMLAQILLEIHNTHHYLGFFRSVREAIKSGNFEQFRLKFSGSKRYHLASEAAVACM
ncbi:hypothetical protein M0R45_026978 [Rubus argutus]|uniref:tRNA-guanine(15) transglycosylase-like domain-containing protein n=1 Tax=Rubus argutus TaxID=59490 RepID=A0AAW1X1T1_RUBAR